MCAKWLLVTMLCAGAAWASDPYTSRAMGRLMYERQLEVACKTGDDTACVELFFSENRIGFFIAAAVLVVITIVSIIICCCCHMRRRASRRSRSRYSSPFQAVSMEADTKSKQTLIA